MVARARYHSRIREDCAALLPILDVQIRWLDTELITHWGQVPRVQRLTTVPGIGPFRISPSSSTRWGARLQRVVRSPTC